MERFVERKIEFFEYRNAITNMNRYHINVNEPDPVLPDPADMVPMPSENRRHEQGPVVVGQAGKAQASSRNPFTSSSRQSATGSTNSSQCW